MSPDVLVQLAPAASTTSSATAATVVAPTASCNSGRRSSLTPSTVGVAATTADAREWCRSASWKLPSLDRRSTTATGTSQRGETSSFTLFILLPSESLSRRLVASAEELSFGVHDFVEILPSPQIVFERDWSHRRRYDIDVLPLRASVGQRAPDTRTPTRPSQRTPSCSGR